MKINYEALFNSHDVSAEGISLDKPHGLGPHEIYTREQIDEIVELEKKRIEKFYQDEMQQKIEEARQAAFLEGKEMGEEMITATAGTLLSAVEKADKEIGDLLSQVKPHLASIAFDLAEKILEIPVKNEELSARISEQIRKLLEQLSSSIDVKIEVSGEDYEIVREALENRLTSNHIVLTVSGDLLPGEFKIDSRQEQVLRCFRKNLADFRESFSLNDEETPDEI